MKENKEHKRRFVNSKKELFIGILVFGIVAIALATGILLAVFATSSTMLGIGIFIAFSGGLVLLVLIVTIITGDMPSF